MDVAPGVQALQPLDALQKDSGHHVVRQRAVLVDELFDGALGVVEDQQSLGRVGVPDRQDPGCSTARRNSTSCSSRFS